MKEGPQTKVEEKGDYCDLQKLVKSSALDYMHSKVDERKNIIEKVTSQAQDVFRELLAKGADRNDIDEAIMTALPKHSFAIVDRTVPNREDVQTPALVRMEFGIALVGILDNVVREVVAAKGEAREKSPDSQVN